MAKKERPQHLPIQFRATISDQEVIEMILAARPALSGNKAAAIREALYVWRTHYKPDLTVPSYAPDNGAAAKQGEASK
jgi:hypothetical protein